MSVIKHRKIFLCVSGSLVVLSWILAAVLGLRQGIDLKGGAEWRIEINSPDVVASEEVAGVVESSGAEFVSARSTGENTFVIRMSDISENDHSALAVTLGEKLGVVREISFSNIGPSVGRELYGQSLKAVIAVIAGISLYVAWAFRKISEPVKSWKYGLIVVITLFHDISIPIGLLAVLGSQKGVEIDTNFIVALLVVMGFSVHDTIVVFDRIRENLLLKLKRHNFGEIIDLSVRETFGRSVNTSLTLIFVLFALLLLGPPALFYFVLTICVGAIFGTYSSIFIASPLLYLWGKRNLSG